MGAGNPTISWETKTQVPAACQPQPRQPHIIKLISQLQKPTRKITDTWILDTGKRETRYQLVKVHQTIRQPHNRMLQNRFSQLMSMLIPTWCPSGPIGENIFLINMYTSFSRVYMPNFMVHSNKVTFWAPINELISFQFFSLVVWCSEALKAGPEVQGLNATWFNMIQGCDWEISFCACLLYPLVP